MPFVKAQEIVLPKPGSLVALSPTSIPPVLKGIKVHPEDPFRFEFILDKGVAGTGPAAAVSENDLKTEANKLIKYFLASLTVPEKDLWVNLSPYEKARIVPQAFGQTEMGRDLLAQDYLLKQLTASLVYPEGDIGKRFWKKVYETAGNAHVPVSTFNKVWIVPDKAVVYENAKAGTAYVVESSLKVLTEHDYLAVEKNHSVGADLVSARQTDQSLIIRNLVIPQLTKEVNEGANFAQLRQVYNSLILATWYKKKIKDSILSQYFADKNKVKGTEYVSSVIAKGSPVTSHKSQVKENISSSNDTELIYQRYLEAFKKGAYNYIKEEQDPATLQIIPRKYFSGGVTLQVSGGIEYTPKGNRAMLVSSSERSMVIKTSLIGSDANQAKIVGIRRRNLVLPGFPWISVGEAI